MVDDGIYVGLYLLLSWSEAGKEARFLLFNQVLFPTVFGDGS